MPEIKKVLFPVDFSQQCRGAAPHVNSIVEHFTAPLTLLHAIAIPPDSYVTYGIDISEALRKEMRESSAVSMNALVAQEFVNQSVRTVIEEGNPAELIANHARDQAIDLIMMPTRGFGPLRRFLIGSVTAKVLHDAHCPVWTSVHTDQPPAPPAATRTILCAVDNGSSSVSLMQWAAWLAGAYGAELKLVHVIPAVNEASMNPGEREVRRYLSCRARDEFANWRSEAGVKAEVQLRGGEIAAAVADTAGQAQADLLVIGRGHIQRRLGGLRTESLAIIRESPCPVISV